MEVTDYINVPFTNLDSKDLNMYYCGHRKNSPGHSYGPAMRDHYLFVYVADGCGVYQINNKTFHIKGKSIFVVFPKCQVYYQSDKQNPWETLWLGVYGNILNRYIGYMGLTPENPVYEAIDHDSIEQMIYRLVELAHNCSVHSQIYSIGLLYQIFSHMISECNERGMEKGTSSANNRYMEMACSYIKFNYHHGITCSDIANYLNLDRSYFSKLFKQNFNMSPTEYLIKYRLKKASHLLRDTDLSINGIAYSVGIHDPFYFSRLFKKHYKVSPQDYKKILYEPFDSGIMIISPFS